MADPTTLIEFANQHYLDRKSEVDDAQTALENAQDSGVATRQNLDTARSEYVDLENQVASIRKQLAVITTPADAAPLLDQLGKKLILLHAQSAKVLEYETQFKLDQIKVNLAQAKLQQAMSALDEAQAQKDQAQKDEDRRTALKSGLTTPPLDTIKADATALLADAIFTAAEARINGDIPDVLRNRARERAKLEADSITRANTVLGQVQDLMTTFLTSKGCADEKLTAPKRAITVAEAALADYVANAKARYDRAKVILEAIGDPNKPPLTQEQHDNINTSDATLQGNRETAADKEHLRDLARDDRDAKEAAYDVEALKVLAKEGEDGLNTALADNTSAVYQAKADFEQAKTDLGAANDQYIEDMHKTLDAWESAVPDATWQDLSDFDWANATLTTLDTVVPADLTTPLTNAENALLAVLLQEDKDAREQDTYQKEMDQRAATVSAVSATATQSIFSALRGDP